MKLTKTRVFIIPIITMLLIALYPLAKILLQIREIQNLYLSFGVIFYLVLAVMVAIMNCVLVIYFIVQVAKNDVPMKALWIILLILFGIFVIPYIDMKYIKKEEKYILNTILYIIPVVFYIFIFIFGLITFNKAYDKKIERQKIIDSTKLEYLTKDNKVSFTFGYGYKQKDIGEYDIYVINEDKGIVFSGFTYNTIDYEQKTVEEFLETGIENLKEGKKEFKVFKKKEEIKTKNNWITTVSYEGKTDIKKGKKTTESDCIYKLSVITFDGNTNYLVYIIEVVTKANYEDSKDELLNLLKTVELKN